MRCSIPHHTCSILIRQGRLWDLAAGKTLTQLTHHKKSVRALAIHPTEFSFASGSAGGNNIKKWKCPEGTFVHNFSGHDAIINTLSVNPDGVLFSGGECSDDTFWITFVLILLIVTLADNGTLTFWDSKRENHSSTLRISHNLGLWMQNQVYFVLRLIKRGPGSSRAVLTRRSRCGWGFPTSFP